jgi:hypothetical protein
VPRRFLFRNLDAARQTGHRRHGFCCGHDGKLIAADAEHLWARELEATATWCDWLSRPRTQPGTCALPTDRGTPQHASAAFGGMRTDDHY